MTTKPSPNFAFLAYHDERLVAAGTYAESLFAIDPVASLMRLRYFGEVLAQRSAARLAAYAQTLKQAELVDHLFDKGIIGIEQRRLFHDLRRAGNDAVHDGKGTHDDALHYLKVARELGVWFQRTFGNNKKFDPGPFVPPSEPAKADAGLHAEMQRLRDDLAARAQELAAAESAIAAQKAAEAELAAKLTANLTAKERADRLAEKAREDAAIWEALANEQSAALALQLEQDKKLVAELAALQAAAAAKPPKEIAAATALAQQNSQSIDLDEAATRRIIDAQLRAAGWEVDSQSMTYERGVRPTKGKNLAIAEWPTFSNGREGWADYVLFAGLKVVGVVEAKRAHKDVSSVLLQAKRYSTGYVIRGEEELLRPVGEGHPWGAHLVPFLFATNGRPYLRQLRTKSGIWFLDARRADNHPTALEGWYTPEGLLDLLKVNVDDAHAQLAVEPMPYIDRDYQRRAILAVERGLKEGRRELLVAMATGTGKTRTCIGLCYRLLKTKRFRRILFLVDRTTLGDQAFDAFTDLRLESLQSFTDIYNVKKLGDLTTDRETKLQFATIQAMVKRVVIADEDVPPVDQFDCLIVDECHRGYLLDRELSEREFEFRDEADYVSKYRRVLDHFDAAKIGLTATPALHTKEIFGAPVFSYSYREAVVDGFLVDHEPPIRIVTKLAQDGIHYDAHEEVTVVDRHTGELRKEELPDAVGFDVEAFNRQVITEPFNRAVLRELANHIDPTEQEKTLVFAATDDHADMVVLLLKEALKAKYGSVDNDAVLKITGATDHVRAAIRRFRNERDPNIAVTVDLLSTGIDVPKIANLVFLRRVGSRILYEQMIGRATRLCPDIGKERFRIFDAVDLYSALKDVTDMKPVVVNPSVTFEQLVKEILETKDEGMRRDAVDELLAKLQRKKRSISGDAAASFESLAGMSVKELVAHLKNGSPAEAGAFLKAHDGLAGFLDRTTGSGSYRSIVSEKLDEVREVTRGYGKDRSKPGDYLEAFRAFLTGNMNKLAALLVVTQRPRDLTREDLRSLKLQLDQEGFNEKALQAAWRDQKNEDIAATIVGYIRQLALGSPLVPYDERVDRAVARLKKTHRFTDPQAKWLGRIAKQVKLETVVDKASLDVGQFGAEGGFKRLNLVFDGKLEALLGELADAVWSDAS